MDKINSTANNKVKVAKLVPYNAGIEIKDGVHNGLYNGEPALIRILKGQPVFVSLNAFLDSAGDCRPSAIFDKRGIIPSSVEIWVPYNLSLTNREIY